MNLDDAQKKTVAGWIAEGLKLAEIQKRLFSELGLTVTYMDVRFLVDDLKLMPKDPPPKVDKSLIAAPAMASAMAPGADAPFEGSALPAGPPPGPGQVSVSVDALARAGSMASGSVAFSDGQSAMWHLDQMGRLGVAPKQAGYKPNPADVQALLCGA